MAKRKEPFSRHIWLVKGDPAINKKKLEDHLKGLRSLGSLASEINKVTNGYAPLHHAAEQGVPEAIEILLESGADVNIRDRAHNTPLHLAAFKDHVSCIEHLVAHGADLLAKNETGKTPLDMSQERSHKRATQKLQTLMKEKNILSVLVAKNRELIEHNRTLGERIDRSILDIDERMDRLESQLSPPMAMDESLQKLSAELTEKVSKLESDLYMTKSSLQSLEKLYSEQQTVIKELRQNQATQNRTAEQLIERHSQTEELCKEQTSCVHELKAEIQELLNTDIAIASTKVLQNGAGEMKPIPVAIGTCQNKEHTTPDEIKAKSGFAKINEGLRALLPYLNQLAGMDQREPRSEMPDDKIPDTDIEKTDDPEYDETLCLLLREKHLLLVENLTPYKARGFLYHQGLLTTQEMDALKSSGNMFEQNESLLMLLFLRDTRTWVKPFFDFLEENHKDLYEQHFSSDTTVKVEAM